MRDEKNASSPKAHEVTIDDIIGRLERQANEAAGADDRRERRWPYRRPNLATTIEHPGGGISRFAAHGVWLWGDGLAFLFSGFAYSGSVCSIVLVAKDGETMLTKGVVTLCKHVDGLHHLAEVKFLQPTDPQLFVETLPNSTSASVAQVELSDLHGKVLHLDDSDFDSKLLAFHLRGSRITLKAVKTAVEALAELKTGDFDIFLCDLNLGGGVSSTELIAQCQSIGFSGPIVILSAENNAAKLAAAKAAGAHHHLPKPYQRDSLIQEMVKLHQQVGAIASSEMLFSTLGDQPETLELLTDYVKQAGIIAQQLDAGIARRDLASVRELCLNIKGSAASYGFAPLGAAAESALQVLDETNSIDAAKPQVRRLALMCPRLGLRAAKPAASSAERKIYTAA